MTGKAPELTQAVMIEQGDLNRSHLGRLVHLGRLAKEAGLHELWVVCSGGGNQAQLIAGLRERCAVQVGVGVKLDNWRDAATNTLRPGLLSACAQLSGAAPLPLLIEAEDFLGGRDGVANDSWWRGERAIDWAAVRQMLAGLPLGAIWYPGLAADATLPRNRELWKQLAVGVYPGVAAVRPIPLDPYHARIAGVAATASTGGALLTALVKHEQRTRPGQAGTAMIWCDPRYRTHHSLVSAWLARWVHAAEAKAERLIYWIGSERLEAGLELIRALRTFITGSAAP